MTKESVAIAGECLQILMLLQTVSKGSECQRGFMSLFLEAIVMIFSASDDNCSQVIFSTALTSEIGTTISIVVLNNSFVYDYVSRKLMT